MNIAAYGFAIWETFYVTVPVSYTHLDVYKRQFKHSSIYAI